MRKIYFIAVLMLTFFTACQNEPWDFPDYDFTTVYFPYQSPVRTIVLGEDIYDNTLDNEHKFKVMATLGGVYENETDIYIDVDVDNSLCDSLYIGSRKALALPENYYTLAAGKQIVIPSGSVMGGIEVQLTDAFFNDPLAIRNNYILPMVMKSVTNADSILSGETIIEAPDRRIAGDWVTVPKDYTLYMVKYINPWHGNYLRRGVDAVKGNNGNSALDTTIVYREKYVEWDEVVSMSTVAIDEVSLSLTTRNKGSLEDVPFELLLKFDGSGNCSVSKPDDAAYSVTGSGEFINDGDAWGGNPRDVMYLNYSVDFGNTTHSFTDTIVMRDRGVALETFTPSVH
ncbi:MAG: DUF1735 domain-containing protein [Prolixibacteraceae bacterium]|nr:DUF1735 domain-containing protein [Prolixibacteraceae bacterium]